MGDRIYRAALLHIQEFRLELERDGMTLICWGGGWADSRSLIRGKKRCIILLVQAHVQWMTRQRELAELRADLERLTGLLDG